MYMSHLCDIYVDLKISGKMHNLKLCNNINVKYSDVLSMYDMSCQGNMYIYIVMLYRNLKYSFNANTTWILN